MMTLTNILADRVPDGFKLALRRTGVRASRFLLAVSVGGQQMSLFERNRLDGLEAGSREYHFRRNFVVSTSRFGIGQVIHSNQTPLGLHRIAKKVGGGHPIGTIFKARQAIGLTWQGQPDATIVHRILWLEGLEPGLNRGGDVDTFRRFVYIHGFGNELTLGRPQSHGCIHLAAADLMPLYEKLPIGTLVWIAKR